MKKKRLDELLIEQGFVGDRKKAFILITAGRVLVNGQKAVSPAQLVAGDAHIEIRPGPEFVGRGAYKLEAAIEKFGVDVRGKVCADVGSSTGGFVEVLLKHGAEKVYAIDVARGKLALKLREDPRVVVMEGVNVLELAPGSAFEKRPKIPSEDFWTRQRSSLLRPRSETMPARRVERFHKHSPGATHLLFDGKVDLVTVDVSFTSLRLVLPVVRWWLAEKGRVIALFKPQYEIEDKSLLKHGILRDERERRELVERFRAWLGENGWQELGFMASPIRGSEGNVEYFFYLQPV